MMNRRDNIGRSEPPSSRVGQRIGYLEPWADAVISGLIASGLLQFVWIWRGYPVPLLITSIICAGLAAVWTGLARLRGWLMLLIPFVLVSATLLLLRLGLGPEAFWQQMEGLYSWFGGFFQWAGPAPAIRYLPQMLLSAPVSGAMYGLARKNQLLLPYLILAALGLGLVLFLWPSAWPATLLLVAAALIQMPRRLVLLIAREHPVEPVLPRGAMQVLAIVLAALVLLSANYLVPDNTKSWRLPALAYWAQDIQDLWQNLSRTGRGWPTYNLVYYGYENPDTQLGGPVNPGRQPILMAVSTRSLLLKGSTRSIYTGSSWQRILQDSYRYDSPVWRTQQRASFADPLARSPSGRQFASYWRGSIEVKIQHRSTQMTLFQSGLVQKIDLGDPVQTVPFFTRDGDLFTVATLAQGEAYTIQSLDLDRRRDGFERALLNYERAFEPQDDPYWTEIQSRYLQLPVSLPPMVPELARSLAGSIDSAYARATTIERYLQTFGTYAQDTAVPPAGSDFVADFLATRRGYCVHYASAMVILARSIGIPARFVEGVAISPGSDSAQFLATGQAAHAWAELYFAGIGWLPFDATPAAPEAPPRDAQTLPEKPEPTPEGAADAGTDASSQGNRNSYRWLWSLMIVPLLLLIGSVFLKIAMHRHLKTFSPVWLMHHHPDQSSQLRFLCQDILIQLELIGVTPEPGETLVQFAVRAQDYVHLEQILLQDVLWPVTRLLYGQIEPSGQELQNLMSLRSQLEQRLQADLPSWTYRLRRVLP
ncbi:MAG: transglutaminase domain-containing protein [Clostridia bacterium]|nr:transglutaminase domain-containing protein [Clostridia bacterium]